MTLKCPDVQDCDAASCASSPFFASCALCRPRDASASCASSRGCRGSDLQDEYDYTGVILR